MVDPCSRATDYAVLLSKCGSIEELKDIAEKIRLDKPNLDGWVDWLRDWYESCERTLTDRWGKR
jgi:hypothetical protein